MEGSMRRNATQCDEPGDVGTAPLAPIQERVLAELLHGQTITAAAETAGVSRSAVHRWLADDDAFVAALNLGKRELRRAAAARLEALADGALACVEQAVADGDARIALGVLRGLGLLTGDPPSIGSDDPKRLASDRRAKQAGDAMLESLRDAMAENDAGFREHTRIPGAR
jgi:hypothetical protein